MGLAIFSLAVSVLVLAANAWMHRQQVLRLQCDEGTCVKPCARCGAVL
jgi:hypothetical protein